jgi:regulatory protein
MNITGFEKKGRRVLVNFDNGRHLVLNYEIFLKNGLRLNESLTEDRFSFLQEENLKYDIKQSAFNLLARRLHSSAELRNKLRQKYHNITFINAVIEYLSVNNYLDDRKFVEEFISEKSKSKLWGNRKIIAEIKKRGISEKIASLEFISGKLENSSDHLRIAAEKKLKNLTYRKTPENRVRQKLTAFLLSKGFDYDEIKNVIDPLLKHLTKEEY